MNERMNSFISLVVLKPELTSESPGGLLKTQIAGPHVQSSVWGKA